MSERIVGKKRGEKKEKKGEEKHEVRIGKKIG